MCRDIIGQEIFDQLDKMEPIYIEHNLVVTELQNIRQFLTHNNLRNEQAKFCTRAIHTMATEMLNEEIHRVGQEYIGKTHDEFPVWLQQIMDINRGKAT